MIPESIKLNCPVRVGLKKPVLGWKFSNLAKDKYTTVGSKKDHLEMSGKIQNSVMFQKPEFRLMGAHGHILRGY